MKNYNDSLQQLMFTKKKLSDISKDERRELYKLYTIRYGSVIFSDSSIENLLINIFSDKYEYGFEDRLINLLKKQVSSAVDDDLIRSFKAESEIKSKSENNEKPF